MEKLAGWSPRTSALEILRSGRLLGARQAQGFSAKRRRVFAVAFAARIVARYWRDVQAEHEGDWALPAAFVEPEFRILTKEVTWLADALGRAAAHVDPVAAAYFIGTAYAAALPPDVRATFGVYYTPPALAARLLDQATAAGIDWDTCTVVDPACGGGAFLAPVTQRIVKQLSHLEPEGLLRTIATRVRGFEIDPFAAWMSQVFLEAVLLPTCRGARRRLPIVVDVRNSLAEVPDRGSYDLVIGNPPYGRVTLSPEQRAQYSASLYGHANLYGVFTELALRLVKPGGLVAFVTPTSFLAGEYFKKLRDLLAHDAPPVAVDFIARRKGVFDGVLQEALLATYRRGGPLGEAPVNVLTPEDDEGLQIVSAGSFTLPNAARAPWVVPRSVAQASLVKRMRSMPHRLADWGYTVSTGPLVWNRHKSQLRRESRPNCLPIIWAEAVASDGRFVLRAAKVNHEPYFKLEQGDDWLVIRRPCVLVQRTTATEQSRRLIACVLPTQLLKQYGGVVVENHLNMIRLLHPSPIVKLAVLAAFLNSGIADRAFRCLSGSVAVSAYELEALPIPSSEAVSELTEAMAQGATREEVDRVCARLYGLEGVD